MVDVRYHTALSEGFAPKYANVPVAMELKFVFFRNVCQNEGIVASIYNSVFLIYLLIY